MVRIFHPAHTSQQGPHRKRERVSLDISEAIPLNSLNKSNMPTYTQNFLYQTRHSSLTTKLITSLTAISQEKDPDSKRTKYEDFFTRLFKGSYKDADLNEDNLDSRIEVLKTKLQERLNFNTRELAGMSPIGRTMAHPAASPVAAVVAALTLLVTVSSNIPVVADAVESNLAPNSSFVDSLSSEPVTNGLERFKRFGLEDGLVGRTFKISDFLSSEGHNHYLTTDTENPMFKRIYQLLYAQRQYFEPKGLNLQDFQVTIIDSPEGPGKYPLSNGRKGEFLLNIRNINPIEKYASVPLSKDDEKPNKTPQ